MIANQAVTNYHEFCIHLFTLCNNQAELREAGFKTIDEVRALFNQKLQKPIHIKTFQRLRREEVSLLLSWHMLAKIFANVHVPSFCTGSRVQVAA